MGRKRSLVNGENNGDVPYMVEDVSTSSKNGLDLETNKRKSRSHRNKYAFYLVRKPLEVTPEELSQANIFIESCAEAEKKVTIGNSDFVVRGANLPSQAFHIPAGALHASETTSSLEADEIVGSIVISRAAFDVTDSIFEEGHDVPLDLIQNLPLKPIKKKVSRKGIKHLRQRLSATGVKNLKSDGISTA